jgi:hypothetical protein
VFRLLTLARVIEPTSKVDSIRVLTEVGIAAPSYPTIKRRLPIYATPEARCPRISVRGACWVGPGDLLHSTVVNMADADGVRSFTNGRFLEKKVGGLRSSSGQLRAIRPELSGGHPFPTAVRPTQQKRGGRGHLQEGRGVGAIYQRVCTIRSLPAGVA